MKLRGYTIIEIVVVLLLTSILTLAVFRIVVNINKLMTVHFNSISSVQEISNLHSLLYNDFLNCISIHKESNSFKCKYDTATINYFYDKNYIIRQTDTFNIVHKNFTLTTIENTNLVESLKIDFEEKNVSFQFFKNYSNKTLFQIVNDK